MPCASSRENIMKAAEDLFTRRRIHEVTLDEVARVARVGKGTIYRHFKDKDDLFFETATAGLDELCALLRERTPSRGPFDARLRAMCQQISDFHRARHELIRMIQDHEGRGKFASGAMRARWKAKHRGLEAAVATILADGVADGHLRSDVKTTVLASFLLGMMRTRGHEFDLSSEHAPSIHAVVDLFLHGAAPPRPIARQSNASPIPAARAKNRTAHR
ncbi:MAG: TetR/AcrR family transcriptional regulator [Candidatus Sumerlaeota bacterium]|nr:TetR/AcrR family transcriptional regulator [Candidatus Sumerlaeota bacterium]